MWALFYRVTVQKDWVTLLFGQLPTRQCSPVPPAPSTPCWTGHCCVWWSEEYRSSCCCWCQLVTGARGSCNQQWVLHSHKHTHSPEHLNDSTSYLHNISGSCAMLYRFIFWAAKIWCWTIAGNVLLNYTNLSNIQISEWKTLFTHKNRRGGSYTTKFIQINEHLYIKSIYI